ncbi:MAG: hypothetical protein VB086_07455 [Clostridiaceae bacterium]|nr:hypothetical protein [Clostridiaceae bacterium]
MLRDAQLVPKPGYVEIEVNGKRTYRNAVTGILINDEVPQPSEVEVLLAKIEELKAAMGVLAASVVMEG